jgi:hypothetical protein
MDCCDRPCSASLLGTCSDGSWSSCDDLFLTSAYASPYQNYGATCSGRFDDWTYAGNCGSAPL